MPNVVRIPTIPSDIYDAFGTQTKRKDYPNDYFLYVDEKGNKKFPYRNPKNGEIHLGLLQSAITSAAQYGYSEIASKAKEIFDAGSKIKDQPLTIKNLDSKGEEVFGVVYAPNEKDSDGDEMDADVIAKACYEYNTFFRSTLYRHKMALSTDQVVLLESYIVPADIKVNDQEIKAGSWVQRWQIKDAGLQRQIREGKIVGFSLGGFVFE